MTRIGILFLIFVASIGFANAAGQDATGSLDSQFERAGFSSKQNKCFYKKITAVVDQKDEEMLASYVADQVASISRRDPEGVNGKENRFEIASKLVLYIDVLGFSVSDQEKRVAFDKLSNTLRQDCLPLFL